MAQCGEESIAADGSQSLDLATAGKGVDGQVALLTARAGAFNFRLSGSAAAADTWHTLADGNSMYLARCDMVKFRACRQTAGTGTLYVTYFDGSDMPFEQ